MHASTVCELEERGHVVDAHQRREFKEDFMIGCVQSSGYREAELAVSAAAGDAREQMHNRGGRRQAVAAAEASKQRS